MFSVRGSVKHRNGTSHTGEETKSDAKLADRETLLDKWSGKVSLERGHLSCLHEERHQVEAEPGEGGRVCQQKRRKDGKVGGY